MNVLQLVQILAYLGIAVVSFEVIGFSVVSFKNVYGNDCSQSKRPNKRGSLKTCYQQQPFGIGGTVRRCFFSQEL